MQTITNASTVNFNKIGNREIEDMARALWNAAETVMSSQEMQKKYEDWRKKKGAKK